MNKRAHIHNNTHQAGFSLVELLLSVGIGALIIMGAMSMANDWASRVKNREEASYILSVNNAATAYVSANMGRILMEGFQESMVDRNGDGILNNDDMVNIGCSIMIPIEDEGTNFYLKDNSVALNQNFHDTTPSGRIMRVYVRNLGFIGDQRTLEIVTVTGMDNLNDAKPLSEVMVRDIAQAIGEKAGVFTARNTTCQNGTFQSLYGSWSLDNASLSGAGRLMPGTPAYCPYLNETQNATAYVAVKERVTYEHAAMREYLYRVAIPGVPEANRMATNLDMNSFPITNVISMSADKLFVDGSASIEGTTGATALFIDEGLRVAGTGSRINAKPDNSDPMDVDCTFSGSPSNKTLNPAVVTPCRLVGGSLRVQGASYEPGRSSLETTGLVASGASLNAQNLEVETAMDIAGNLGVDNAMSVSGTTTSGQVVSMATTVGGAVTTTALQAAQDSTLQSLDTADLTARLLSADASIATSSTRVLYDLGTEGPANFQQGLTVNQLQTSGLSGCTATVRHVYPWGPNNYQMVAPYNCTGNGPN